MELIAGAVAGSLIKDWITNKASLLVNLRMEVEWLKETLTYIYGSLGYADEQAALDASAKQWVAEATDIAHDAEDIVAECAIEPLYAKTTRSRVCRFSALVFRYKMGKRIKDLKHRFSSAMKKAGELNLVRQVLNPSQPSTSTSERGAELKRWSLLCTDSRLVGVEEKVNEIVGLLEQPAVDVVAVLGMCGLGKTFLVQHVYDRIDQRYEHSAWISLSKTCSLRVLLLDLASQIYLRVEADRSDELIAELIYKHLEGKRCLIVLDNVWKSSVQGDLIQRLGLPTGSNSQCKVVVTTRDNDVAANMTNSIYKMRHLSARESWDLFCLFAFPDSEGNRPPNHLDSVAHIIVEKCGRLPLALMTVATSMARSSAIADWESKLKQLMDVVWAEDSTMQILKLSYDSLPSHLKFYFSYLSFFPESTQISFSRAKENRRINQEYLIYLLMAEGFIPQDHYIEQGDAIGLSYLQQLQHLLEVHRVETYYAVNDLIFDLVIRRSRENKCEFELPEEKTNCRRLLLPRKAIATNAISQSSLQYQRFLRTISFSQNQEITSFPEHLFDQLRVLRILDFSSTAISTLPVCVGKLKLLKVLNLSQTKIREVPDCVRRLKCLEYLDVSGCTNIQRVPDWIGELQSLSHLDLYNCSEELIKNDMPKGISNLLSLRTLRSGCFPLSVGENVLNVKDVGSLTNLQEISFRLEDPRALKSLENGVLQRLLKMRILKVFNHTPTRESGIEESNLTAFPDKMHVMEDLEQLWLVGFSLPRWIRFMGNLTELKLYECSDYPALQNMPSLELLILRRDSRCRELPKNFGKTGGFPKLIRFVISDFSVLEDFPMLEEGAMQHLEVLEIINCPQLKEVPEGLERLKRLKKI